MSLHWGSVRYFEESEFADPNHPGSGQYINGMLLMCADKLRHESGWAIMPHWELGGCVDMDGSHGHADDSTHLYNQGCKAFDFHFADPVTFKPLTISLEEQFYKIKRGYFDGVGIYPGWKIPGFHVDVGRPKELFWVRRNGIYTYFRR